jgi:hypothetical protein
VTPPGLLQRYQRMSPSSTQACPSFSTAVLTLREHQTSYRGGGVTLCLWCLLLLLMLWLLIILVSGMTGGAAIPAICTCSAAIACHMGLMAQLGCSRKGTPHRPSFETPSYFHG